MATLLDNSNNQNARCFACGSLVYAVEKKMTAYHIYHNRCFRCRICKRILTGYSLNEEGDDIYCENCYRRKQRGDCDSFEFHRAATERAQYVHNRHHPDQQTMSRHPRSSSLRDTSRRPSLTLRQLERQFLSHQPSIDSCHDETTNELSEKSRTKSYPSKINAIFSIPINMTHNQHDSSSSQYEKSRSPCFSSVFSPFPTIRTQATITPRLIPSINEFNKNEEKNRLISSSSGNAIGSIEFRLNKGNIDITNIDSPRTDQKNIIIPDLNQNNERKESKFRFPTFNIKTIHRRSSSAHYSKNSSSNN